MLPVSGQTDARKKVNLCKERPVGMRLKFGHIACGGCSGCLLAWAHQIHVAKAARPDSLTDTPLLLLYVIQDQSYNRRFSKMSHVKRGQNVRFYRNPF
jgi:hypothetical protein